MSERIKPEKSKLVICFFSKERNLLDKLEKILIKKFGKIDFRSEDRIFNETSYYEEEMGKQLLFRMVSFERLIEREKLIKVKHISWSLEKKFSYRDGEKIKRNINIDPGLLTLENFILATGKNFSHRIYLGKNVFADLTLIYSKKKFIDLPWTYMNYKSDDIKNNLYKIREIYYKQLKSLRK